MHAKAGSIGTASIATKVAWKVYMGTSSKGEKSPISEIFTVPSGALTRDEGYLKHVLRPDLRRPSNPLG